MEKFTQIKEHLLEIAFFTLLIRMLIPGAGIAEALALISVVVSIAYGKYLNKDKVTQYEELKKQLEDMAAKVNSLAIEKSFRKPVNEVQDTPAKPIKRFF